MDFHELDVVVLMVDLPEVALRKGDVGTIVDVHPGGHSFEVEFNARGGFTAALESLTDQQIRPLGPDELFVSRVLVA